MKNQNFCHNLKEISAWRLFNRVMEEPAHLISQLGIWDMIKSRVHVLRKHHSFKSMTRIANCFEKKWKNSFQMIKIKFHHALTLKREKEKFTTRTYSNLAENYNNLLRIILWHSQIMNLTLNKHKSLKSLNVDYF